MTDFREFEDGELVPGTRYRVLRLIGSGGMGRVYEVEHFELGKRFVLKALQRELARREDLVARLRNEWRALARLEHPNIVGVTDAGTSENGVPFYVMERLEGETLSSLLHRTRRLLPQQALGIAAGILEGLHAAHQIGVIHRDVKPPNIFLIGPTTVKVLDFGIAKIKDVSNVITARGMAVGTPRYMSPEQANGSAVDARSDIYATGLMLFEMVSGIGPFDDARDPNELLLAQLGRKAPLLSSISVVAPELDALVAAMLAKDPRERPADAHKVAVSLRSLAQRYDRYVATDAPTRSGAPDRTGSEPPTRVEGQRRQSQPAAAPQTRPDGLAAGRHLAGEDTTTLQPRLEIATTAVPSSRPGSTQRLPEAAPPPLTLYGSDTLIDRATSAPTTVPESAPERTEMLLIAPPTPNGSAPIDAGVTRTAVPLVDAPNLTPPPVVPTPQQPLPQSRPGRTAKWAISILLPLGIIASLWVLRRAAPEPSTAPAVRAASPVPTSAAILPEPAPSEVAPRASTALAPHLSRSSMSPPVPVASVTGRNDRKNSDGSPGVASARPAGAAPAAKTVKANGSLPGSGL